VLSVVRLMLQQIDQRRAASAASAAIEAKIMAVAKADPTMRRLATIPGVGGLTAHAPGLRGCKEIESDAEYRPAWMPCVLRDAPCGRPQHEVSL